MEKGTQDETKMEMLLLWGGAERCLEVALPGHGTICGDSGGLLRYLLGSKGRSSAGWWEGPRGAHGAQHQRWLLQGQAGITRTSWAPGMWSQP